MTAWCHGAPGIGLSRLRAYQILKEEKYLRDFQYAFDATMRAMKDITNSNHLYDYSPCHGLAGLCELLLQSTQVFHIESHNSIAVNTGVKGIEKCLNSGKPWPCGIHGGETPSLMLGWQGSVTFI
jgi:lantibiotic biosynthesis protein